MTDKDLSNVIQLFPNSTDGEYSTNEEYENDLIPALIGALGVLGDDCRSGNYDLYINISESLIRYARRSLITLDALRRDGTFDDCQLPPITAFDVDNLVADSALATGGSKEMVENFRYRSGKKECIK